MRTFFTPHLGVFWFNHSSNSKIKLNKTLSYTAVFGWILFERKCKSPDDRGFFRYILYQLGEKCELKTRQHRHRDGRAVYRLRGQRPNIATNEIGASTQSAINASRYEGIRPFRKTFRTVSPVRLASEGMSILSRASESTNTHEPFAILYLTKIPTLSPTLTKSPR